MNSFVQYLHIGRFDHQRLLHFAINLAVGVAIALLFILSSKTDWGEQLTNQGFDILVRMEQRFYSQKNAAATSPVYIIDITHDNYRSWQRPEITPRGKVAKMIEAGWKEGAAVVMVDMLMPRTNPDDPQGDEELRSLLVRMVKEKATTHVILPVTINYDEEIGSHYLDDLLDRPDAGTIIHRGFPVIEATTADRLNRYWAPYQPYFDRQGAGRILWSAPLLASVIREEKLAELTRIEHALVLQAEGEHGSGEHGGQAITLGGKVVEIPPYHREQGEGGPVLQREEAHSGLYTQRIRFRLSPETPSTARLRLTADKFIAGGENPLPDLHGKVLLIGNTSPDLGDYHWTPVGRISGVYIMLNVINTLSSGLQPVHMNPAIHLLIELFVIVVAAYVFLFFNSITAQILTSVLFVLLFFPISWLIYDSWGLFFNFVLPLVGMSFHKSAANMEKLINKPASAAH